MDSSRSGLLSTFLMTLPLIIVPAMALLRPPNPSASVSSQTLAAEESDPSEEDLGFPDDFSGTPTADNPSQDASDADIDVPLGAVKTPSDTAPKPNSAEQTARSPADPDAGSDPFQQDEIPENSTKGSPKEAGAPAPNAPNPRLPRDPAGPQAPESADADRSSTKRLVQQLNALGAIRTLWFDAGDRTPVGFAAFFRGQTELTVYRFEAVGQTRAECAQDVLDQVTAWRRQSANIP